MVGEPSRVDDYDVALFGFLIGFCDDFVMIYATRAKGDGTRRAYRSAWRQYETWCHSLGRAPLAADPDTIAMYVVRCADAGLAVSSIRVALAAIKTAHLLAGLSLDLRHPRLAMVVEGVTRRCRRQSSPRRHAPRRAKPRHRSVGYLEPTRRSASSMTLSNSAMTVACGTTGRVSVRLAATLAWNRASQASASSVVSNSDSIGESLPMKRI
jgi:hypothetical protein